MALKNIVRNIIDDIKEDARKQHEKDKEAFEAIKAESKARFEKATETTPEMKEFLDAKGLKEKAKVVAEHAKRNAKKIREEDIKKKEEILKKDREKMQKVYDYFTLRVYNIKGDKNEF